MMFGSETCENYQENNMKDIDTSVEVLKEWIQKQPHLPHNISDQLLKRFITSARMSAEGAKNLVDLNFTLRSQAPEIFSNRDPQNDAVQSILDCVDYCPLPKLTDKKHKVMIYRLIDNDPNKFNYADALKVFFMVADIRMHIDLEQSEGEIPIFDMGGTSLKHLTKLSLPLLKKYMVFTQEAMPVRLRKIHIVNTAPLLDKILVLLRPFLKSEVAKLLTFHTPNSTSLFEHIPIDLIPPDYGGKLEFSMKEIKEEWRNNLESNKDFFMDKTRWDIDENKRPMDNDKGNKNYFGMQGSFKSLSID